MGIVQCLKGLGGTGMQGGRFSQLFRTSGLGLDLPLPLTVLLLRPSDLEAMSPMTGSHGLSRLNCNTGSPGEGTLQVADGRSWDSASLVTRANILLLYMPPGPLKLGVLKPDCPS